MPGATTASVSVSEVRRNLVVSEAHTQAIGEISFQSCTRIDGRHDPCWMHEVRFTHDDRYLMFPLQVVRQNMASSTAAVRGSPTVPLAAKE